MRKRPFAECFKITFSRVLNYYFFAKQFGWTPEEVDKVDAKTLEYLMIIEKYKGGLSRQDERGING